MRRVLRAGSERSVVTVLGSSAGSRNAANRKFNVARPMTDVEDSGVPWQAVEMAPDLRVPWTPMVTVCRLLVIQVCWCHKWLWPCVTRLRITSVDFRLVILLGSKRALIRLGQCILLSTITSNVCPALEVASASAGCHPAFAAQSLPRFSLVKDPAGYNVSDVHLSTSGVEPDIETSVQ